MNQREKNQGDKYEPYQDLVGPEPSFPIILA